MINLCFLVMPCLNEEMNLRDTCASLGFGSPYDGRRSHHHLVIVDNGSSDGTIGVAESIRDMSLAGTVHIVRESTLGFVTARSAGVDYVKQHVRELRCPQSECLVLQVDADAVYSRDYSQCFENAACLGGIGNLYEAESVLPNRASDAEFALLRDLTKIDEQFFEEKSSGQDFVVDDKMVGYFLSDWESVGGLKREFLGGREYLYCGTSRMWIRMHRQGFRRRMVPGASCAHSLRKLEEGADIFSATAGWPRSSIWKKRWRSTVGKIPTAEELLAPSGRTLWADVISERERHLASLFIHLPKVLEEAGRETMTITPLDALVAAFARNGIDLKEDLQPVTV
jgi:hypothetical protein